MIYIVDYGMGNLGSIENMFRKLGKKSEITSDPDKILSAEKLILPGVGAFDEGMRNIERFGLRSSLDRVVLVDKIPVLGICLGMQLLSEGSEEGSLPGLGWIKGTCKKFTPTSEHIKVPHMGWNTVNVRKPIELFKNYSEIPRFYFVHSYHFHCADDQDILATTSYDGEFTSAVSKANIHGVQFHPEKSHKMGMKLLLNFSEV